MFFSIILINSIIKYSQLEVPMKNSQAKLKKINRKEIFLKNRGLKNLEKGRVKLSRNVNEVIRAALNFFCEKFHTHQRRKTYISEQKQKRQHFMRIKNAYSRICAFGALLCFCVDACLYVSKIFL